MAELPRMLRDKMAEQAPEKSAFERHGIDHLSASSLNTWIASPALWIMERLIGRRAPMGCAAHRGTAAEAGVAHGLFDPAVSAPDCAILALKRYDELAAGSVDPKKDQERDVVAGMVAQGLLALRPLGVPEPVKDGHQHRIELSLEDLPVPVIGFLDFWFPALGRIIDLKTTMRVPSSMSDPHRRQGSGYQHAHQNAGIDFVYCSDKRSASLTLERPDYEAGLRELHHSALRLHRFLSLSNDPYELAELVTPDYGSFYWSSPEAREFGRLTFGF